MTSDEHQTDKSEKHEPGAGTGETLNPVNRKLLTKLIALQRKQLGKIATLLAGHSPPEYVPPALRSLPKEVGGLCELNLEQLSHGLSGRYQDGELSAPMWESLSELFGIAGGVAGAATDHPMIGLFGALHTSLHEVITGYLILHAAALSAQNSLLAEISLAHLKRLHTLVEKVASAIPEITVAELSHLEVGFSSKVGRPASEHTTTALHRDD